MHPVMFNFSGEATRSLLTFWQKASERGLGPVWLRLRASHVRKPASGLRMFAVTDAAPTGDLVLLRNNAGDPLVTISWRHPNKFDGQIVHYGNTDYNEIPDLDETFFTTKELESLFTFMASFNAETVLEVAA